MLHFKNLHLQIRYLIHYNASVIIKKITTVKVISPNEHSGINKSLLKQIKHKEKKNEKLYCNYV